MPRFLIIGCALWLLCGDIVIAAPKGKGARSTALMKQYAQAVEAAYRFRFEDAIATLNHILKTDPTLTLAHIRLADIYTHPFLRDKAQANIHLIEAEKLKDRLSPQEQLYLAAVQAKVEDRLDTALKDLMELARQDSTDQQVLFDLAEALYWQGKPSEAQTAYERVLKLDPNYAPALNHLAYTLFILEGADKGIPLLERCVAQEPKEPNWHDSLGDLYRSKDEHRAMAEYEKAVHLRPDFYVAWQKLAGLYNSQGREDDTIEAYKHVKTFAPTPAAKASAYPALWTLSLERNRHSAEAKREIEQELEQLVASGTRDPALLDVIARGYRMIGQRDQANAIEDAMIAADPKGMQAQSVKLRQAYEMEDPRAKAAQFEAFLSEFPESPMKMGALSGLFAAYTECADDAAVRATGEQVLTAAVSMNKASAYRWVAEGYADRGLDLDKAQQLAEQAMDLGEADLARMAKQRPPSASDKEWQRMMTGSRVWYLDTLGWVYLKQGQLADAEAKLIEALKLAESINAPSEALLFHLGALAERKGTTAAALALYHRSLGSPNSTGKAKPALLALYQRQGKSLVEAEQAIAEAKAQAQEQAWKKLLAERLDQPAPEFSLQDLGGKTVTLSALKGKVVLVDFWATWCGPCKLELPLYQQVHERYKSKEVVCLAISTDDVSTRAEVKPFVEENRYTFPVLYDKGAAKAYEVLGIPTLFVIDRAGRIQYRHVGYRKDLVEILSRQIDALLAEQGSQ